MMSHHAAKFSIALALAFAAVNAAPASANPDGPQAGDALQDARQSKPKYGGRSGGSYGAYDYRLRVRYDYGFDGSTSSRAAQGAMKKAAAHQHTAKCQHLGHGAAPGATRTAPNTSGEKKPPANQSTRPKKSAPSGKKDRGGRYDVSRDPKGVDSPTTGAKGGFSEAAGLELEVQPIEYRDGSSGEYHKTKQPGIPKYGNITLQPPQHNDGMAKEFLREIKFRIAVEELESEHFPDPKGKPAPRR